ncbi:MAG: hypothetical protein PVJ61_03395 [Dehalococcoidia bacterium]|jgi:DNA-directed RNA polymerase specialized sigma54-like protein
MAAKQQQSMEMQQRLSQVLRMEQATLLEMPEDEFRRLIVEIERSPLFRKLYGEEKLIRRQRLPGTDISPRFYQLKEDIAADSGSLDIESLLLNKRQIVEHIRKMGLENFKRHFLFPETGMAPERIAAECGLKPDEVQEINELINDFSIQSEFYHPSTLNPDVMRYAKVASLEKRREGFVIGYFSPALARGKYEIDYERLERLKADGALSSSELKKAKKLLAQLELINTRQDTVSRIIQGVIERQALYLDSGEAKALLPFTRKELAEKIGLAPSSISRAVRGKSLETPQGKEVPLSDFFPRPRRFKKELLKQLLDSESGLDSDEAIRARLQEKFGVSISRRSVAHLRQELKIPSSRGKTKPAVRARS